MAIEGASAAKRVARVKADTACERLLRSLYEVELEQISCLFRTVAEVQDIAMF